MTNLDKNRPYGTMYGGSSGAAFYQDGKEYRVDGTPIDGSAASPAPVVTPEPAPVVEAAPEPAEDGVTREQLEALHVSKLKKLMELQGLTPEAGPGSKAKNIEILLANG